MISSSQKKYKYKYHDGNSISFRTSKKIFAMISMTTTWNLTTVNIVLCAVRCKNKIKQKLTFLDRPFRNSSVFFKTICWFENRNFCCCFSK